MYLNVLRLRVEICLVLRLGAHAGLLDNLSSTFKNSAIIANIQPQ